MPATKKGPTAKAAAAKKAAPRKKYSDTVGVNRAELEKLIAEIDRIRKDETAETIDLSFESSTMMRLLRAINELTKTLDEHSEEFRETTMSMALGLSDCFQVLAAVRSGDLSARVGEETVGSQDELIAQFGLTLNMTVADVEEQMGTITQQQDAIAHLVKQLQTPILQLWDDVLALPVIGMVDSRRSAEMMETLLSEIIASQCKYVILDITGVEIVDTKTADHFVKVMKSAELLGANCIMTGIRPAVAQTLVELGVDLTSISTLRNLQEGLSECLRRMEIEKAGAVRAIAKR